MNDDNVRLNLVDNEFYIRLNNITIYAKGINHTDALLKQFELLRLFLGLCDIYGVTSDKEIRFDYMNSDCVDLSVAQLLELFKADFTYKFAKQILRIGLKKIPKKELKIEPKNFSFDELVQLLQEFIDKNDIEDKWSSYE